MYDHESVHDYLCECPSCKERNARQQVRLAELRASMYRNEKADGGTLPW